MQKDSNDKVKKILFILSFSLIFLRILSYAWCCDDAFHAYTMASNLIAGKGFTPTPGTRVNVSTCPLWTLIVASGMLFWNNPYAVGMIFNLLFSGTALFMLLKLIYRKENWRVVLTAATVMLCLSKTYLSFTTSGLENALTIMLCSFYLYVFFGNEYYSGKELFKIAFLEGLIAFTRMDCALIFSFTSVYAFLFRYRKDENDKGGFSLKKLCKVVPVAISGLSPFIFWELFSLFYFGSLIPNTALAKKLNTGFPTHEYLIRGFWYFVFSNALDFIILPVFFTAVVTVCGKAWKKRKELTHSHVKEVFLAAGLTLYFFYVFDIGGDFMLGRHFFVLFWISLFVLTANFVFNSWKYLLIFLPTVLFAAFAALILSPIHADSGESVVSAAYNSVSREVKNHISHYGYMGDTQEFTYPYTGLKNVLQSYFETGEARSIQACPCMGINWFFGNKAQYEWRFYDPLLSRLPGEHSKYWGTGLVTRKIPSGYFETLLLNENHIQNKNLAFYYSKLKFIVSGDLLDSERLKETLLFNSGVYDAYLRKYIAEEGNNPQ